jgi:glycosyltransferase involved in cell wall biosynthesis
MKICIDGRLLFPHMTGIGRYLIGLLSGFTHVDQLNQYEFWLQPGFPSLHPLWEFQSANIHLKEISIRPKDIRQSWQIPSVLRASYADIYHNPHFNLSPFIPGNIVSTIHDLKYLSFPNYFITLPGIKRLIIFLLIWMTLVKSKQVIAVSEHTRQDILKYFKVDPAKINVIYSGVDRKFFNQQNQSDINNFRVKHGLSMPFLLTVGERRPHKNLVTLIKAFEYFRSSGYTNYHLVIAGKPYANYRDPEKLVDTLNLGEVVHFLNYVGEDELPLLYQSADIFAFLSNYEGFGLPILEAMASGLPVISANNSSLQEVAGNAALLVSGTDPEEIAKAFIQVIPGSSTRENKTQRGISHAQKFTWDECASKTLAVYQKANL